VWNKSIKGVELVWKKEDKIKEEYRKGKRRREYI
jgi:hypothetical protein